MTDAQQIWTATVLPEWIDHNGHMNAGYYLVAFDDATGPWTAFLGIDPTYRRSRRRSTFSIDCHLTWLRELPEGAPIVIEAELLGFDDKKYHTFMRMLHAEEGYVAATHELLSIHIDLDTRRSTLFPREIHERFEEVLRTQGRIAGSEDVGRVIRTKPWPPDATP